MFEELAPKTNGLQTLIYIMGEKEAAASLFKRLMKV